MAHSRRRRRWVVLAVLASIVVALVVVRAFVLDDEVHRVTPDEALRNYHEHTTTSAEVARSSTTTGTDAAVAPVVQTLPAPGVYVYRTAGGESIDAVGGSTHTYPEETTITVVAEGCGVVLRWDALQERRERWRLCLTDDGIAIQADGGQSFHEFFGQTQVEDITCDRAVMLVPRDGQPRAPTALTCLLGEAPWQPVWQVLERSTRTVGTTTIVVQHVRMTIADDDQFFEHLVLDWYLDEHGLPVAATLTKESLSDTAFGDVTYTEHYDNELASLTPLQ